MKMPPATYARIESLMRAKFQATGQADILAYKAKLALDPRVKDQAKRFRWDLFWAATQGDNRIESSDLYAGELNDDHVDTALRAIVRDLERAS